MKIHIELNIEEDTIFADTIKDVANIMVGYADAIAYREKLDVTIKDPDGKVIAKVWSKGHKIPWAK